jgi:hypothetical protein
MLKKKNRTLKVIDLKLFSTLALNGLPKNHT